MKSVVGWHSSMLIVVYISNEKVKSYINVKKTKCRNVCRLCIIVSNFMQRILYVFFFIKGKRGEKWKLFWSISLYDFNNNNIFHICWHSCLFDYTTTFCLRRENKLNECKEKDGKWTECKWMVWNKMEFMASVETVPLLI